MQLNGLKVISFTTRRIKKFSHIVEDIKIQTYEKEHSNVNFAAITEKALAKKAYI